MTLIEILLAATVLVVALLGMAGMFPVAYQNIKFGGQMSKATALAQEMMEILRNESFTNLDSYKDLNTSACGSGTDSIATNCRKWRDDINAVGLPSGSGSIDICTTSCTSTDDLAQVTVAVDWTERTGSKKVELVTYVAQ